MNRNRGLKVLDEMLGTEAARDVRQNWHEICPDFEKYVVEFLSGEVWARPRLSRKIKSLCTIAALAALGRNRGLELNIRMARNNGASREEIQETLLQIAPYAGFPAAWEALVLTNQVLGTDQGGGRKSTMRRRKETSQTHVLALDRTSRLRHSKN
jgi:4-carboxymuconolactone decarboxylase